MSGHVGSIDQLDPGCAETHLATEGSTWAQRVPAAEGGHTLSGSVRSQSLRLLAKPVAQVFLGPGISFLDTLARASTSEPGTA